MQYPRILLTDAAPPDPWSTEQPPGPWRALEAVLADLDAAKASGARLVYLMGHRPHTAPHLTGVLAGCRARAMAPAMACAGHGLDAQHLASLDLEVLELPLHAEPARHDARVGVPGAFEATIHLIETVTLRVRLVVRLADPTADPRPALACAAHAEAVTLQGDPALRLTDRAAVLGRVVDALPADAPVILEQLDTPPDAALLPPRPYTPLLERIRVRGGWVPGLAGGVVGGGDPTRLYGLGMPRRDAPWSPPVDPDWPGPFAVVVCNLGDQVMAMSTLPTLVTALRAQGAKAELLTVWSPPWNLHVPLDIDPLVDPGWRDGDVVRQTARADVARTLAPAFLEHLDLSGHGTVIVPGYDVAAAVLTNPSLPAHAKVVCLDMHLHHGLDALVRSHLPDGARAEDGAWFPEDRLTVVNCFPGYVGNAVRHGIPETALRWVPYPLAREHLPLPTTPPTGPLVTAGNHRRDWAVLHAALDLLDDPPQVWVISGTAPPPHPAFRHTAHMSVPELYDAVASAPAVVLPIVNSPTDAAGITVAALAHHAGTPVVGTRTWGLLDHAQPSDVLVDPQDPAALAHALTTCRRTRVPPRPDIVAWIARGLTEGTWPHWPERP